MFVISSFRTALQRPFDVTYEVRRIVSNQLDKGRTYHMLPLNVTLIRAHESFLRQYKSYPDVLLRPDVRLFLRHFFYEKPT